MTEQQDESTVPEQTLSIFNDAMVDVKLKQNYFPMFASLGYTHHGMAATLGLGAAHVKQKLTMNIAANVNGSTTANMAMHNANVTTSTSKWLPYALVKLEHQFDGGLSVGGMAEHLFGKSTVNLGGKDVLSTTTFALTVGYCFM